VTDTARTAGLGRDALFKNAVAGCSRDYVRAVIAGPNLSAMPSALSTPSGRVTDPQPSRALTQCRGAAFGCSRRPPRADLLSLRSDIVFLVYLAWAFEGLVAQAGLAQDPSARCPTPAPTALPHSFVATLISIVAGTSLGSTPWCSSDCI